MRRIGIEPICKNLYDAYTSIPVACKSYFFAMLSHRNKPTKLHIACEFFFILFAGFIYYEYCQHFQTPQF